MKIARLDNLVRQDNLFDGGEPDNRYERRQMVIVQDNYDFVTNNATDITNLDNLHLCYKRSLIDYPTYKLWLEDYNIYDVDSVSDSIKGIQINDSNLANQGIMCYNSSSSILEYVYYNPVMNVININSKQDFIDVATSHTSGIITLTTNVYNIGNDIDLVDDTFKFITDSVVGFISASSKSTKLSASNSTSSLFNVDDTEFSIRNLNLACPNGEIFKGCNLGRDKEIIIDGCFVGNANKLGTITGFKDVHIEENHFYSFDNGFNIINGLRHIHLTNSFIKQSPNNGTTGSTFLTFDNSTSGMLDITNCNFESTLAEDIAIDVSNGAIFDISAIVQRNQFTDYTQIPLKGANSNTPNWYIASRTNVGLAGLYTENIPICTGAYSTASTTFGQVPETHTIKSSDYYEAGSTTIKGTISATISHDQNGGGVEIDLYNLTDSVSVTNSIISTTITTGDTYQIEEGLEFVLEQNKEYRLRIKRLTGSGQSGAKIRSATLEIKVY